MPRRSPKAQCVVAQSLPKPFSRMCRGPICTTALSVRPDSPQELGCFCTGPKCTATRVHRLLILKEIHVRVASLFLLQRSRRMIITAAISNASFVRDRGARTRAMFLQEELRRVRPRTEEKEEKGSSRSKRFLESLDSRFREIEGRNAAWLVPAEGQALVAALEQAANHYQSQNPRKGKPHPHGSKKSDISSWFTKRAFSNQSGQGGPAATDHHHRETGQAPHHCEQAIDHQTKGDVGANAQNVHEPGTSSHGDRSVRVVQDKENLRSICSVSPSKRGARSTRSGITFIRWTGRRPEDHM